MRIVLTRRESLSSADGVSIFMVALAQAFSDLNHEVTIVVGSMSSEAEYRRLLSPRLDLHIIPLSHRPLTGLSSVTAWLRGKRIIDRLRPDLIIHNEAVPLPFHSPTVHVVHDLQPRHGRLAPLWRAIRRFSMRHSDYVVASTVELRDQIARELGKPPRQFKLITKCIDLQMYRRSGLTKRERAIIHAGTERYKDPTATIRAFGALNDPSVTLYITGPVTEAIKEALNALPSGLRGRVILLGALDGLTIRNLYQRVRVASFPSRYAVPVASATVMEASAAGTPIVGSRSLSRNVLVDGINGLTSPTDPTALAATLKLVLDDDAVWRRLSKGASQMVKHFDATKIAAQYIDLVAEASAPKRIIPSREEIPAIVPVRLEPEGFAAPVFQRRKRPAHSLKAFDEKQDVQRKVGSLEVILPLSKESVRR